MMKFLAFSLPVLLSASFATAQIAEITVLPTPTPTPAGRTTTTTVTTITTTVTNADGTQTTTTAESPQTPVPTATAAQPVPTAEAPSNVVNDANSPPSQAPAVWVDDGSMDTRSQIERTRRNLRAGMSQDPWLAGLVNRISMSAEGESITLTGEVNHSQEREAIERLTRDAAGNLRVINSIRVR